MSDFFISSTLAIVIALVLIAFFIRAWHVQDFTRRQKATHFAKYVVETVHKQPHLYNSHGFYIDPTLSDHVVLALQRHLPQAVVTVKGAMISLTHKQATWIIPICTTEEYTELYI